MSLTGSLSNALSGLAVSSKAAQLVSANVANATTEGYAARSLQTSAASLGGNGTGVRIDGVTRQVDQILISDRRAADAAVAQQSFVANFYANMEAAIGLPGDAGSLKTALVGFESALIDASSRPDQAIRLHAAATAAVNLAGTLNGISEAVQSARQDADREIAQQVMSLNATLEQVEDVNREISKHLAAGRDALGLLDHRQSLVDKIATIVPVSVLPRDNGQIALVSSGGGILLDGSAARFAFTASHVISPDMTVQSGALGQVSMNGNAIDLGRSTNMLQGGALDALFLIRDELATGTQASLDGLAADLITRFEDPSVDLSLTLGDPGLFTDAGATYDPLNEVGLSQRLAVNASIDPALGGEVWRIRDGIGATSEGSPGNALQIAVFIDVLSEKRPPVSAAVGLGEKNVFGLSSEVLSSIGLEKQNAENTLIGLNAKWEALRLAEFDLGVDTDAEMQKLLQIENAYAANAKVIETIEQMFDEVSRI